MADRFDRQGKRIAAHPRMKQILDKANQDHACFASWIAAFLRADDGGADERKEGATAPVSKPEGQDHGKREEGPGT